MFPEDLSSPLMLQSSRYVEGPATSRSEIVSVPPEPPLARTPASMPDSKAYSRKRRSLSRSTSARRGDVLCHRKTDQLELDPDNRLFPASEAVPIRCPETEP